MLSKDKYKDIKSFSIPVVCVHVFFSAKHEKEDVEMQYLDYFSICRVSVLFTHKLKMSIEDMDGNTLNQTQHCENKELLPFNWYLTYSSTHSQHTS